MQHRRPKMTLLQRAKQFMPFAALKGFQELLEETARYTESRKELSEEQLEELDRQLCSMVRGQRVNVVYYTRGRYHQVEGMLEAINRVHRSIKVQGQQFSLSPNYKAEFIRLSIDHLCKSCRMDIDGYNSINARCRCVPCND